MKAPKWKVALASFLLIGLGFGLGAGTTIILGVRKMHQVLNNSYEGTRPLDRTAERIQRDMTKELDLTPEESLMLQSRIGELTSRLKTIRADAVTSARHIVDDELSEIAKNLPEQKRMRFYESINRRIYWIGLSLRPEDEGLKAADPGK